jgi:hypothetical protein
LPDPVFLCIKVVGKAAPERGNSPLRGLGIEQADKPLREGLGHER